ncbi:MAG: GNAT family N-acetyltransferase [Tissierellia bacterium]|nr:GNAT family N-acetyltransferase [Tissierellia bacterium]
MDIEYKKIEISKESLNCHNEKYLEQLVLLSNEWEAEKCSPSYSTNSKNYFIEKELFVAIIGDEIVAYALGEINTLKEATSYNKIGEKSFELDELYVAKPYRKRKIGQQLYLFLESYLNTRVDLIGVIATSFRYKELLSFYIDELEMNFNHALLVKRI